MDAKRFIKIFIIVLIVVVSGYFFLNSLSNYLKAKSIYNAHLATLQGLIPVKRTGIDPTSGERTLYNALATEEAEKLGKYLSATVLSGIVLMSGIILFILEFKKL